MTAEPLLPFESRDTLVERVRDLFLSRPGEPIDIDDQIAAGGKSGYRTRVSDARRRYGMDIRPERPMQRWPDGKPRPRAIYWPATPERRGVAA